jgi:imidazolonepropionase-like amidohydrolase
VKTAVARGLVPGPRMQISLAILSQTGGHGDQWTVCGLSLDELGDHPALYLDDEAIGTMVERGTWLVPTLMAPGACWRPATPGSPCPRRSSRRRSWSWRCTATPSVEAGVRVATGTDSGVTPHGRNLRELGLMVEAGLSPVDALRAATSSAAALLRLEGEIGSLDPGRRADVVVVDGDPLDVATLAERVTGVWQDGLPVAR